MTMMAKTASPREVTGSRAKDSENTSGLRYNWIWASLLLGLIFCTQALVISLHMSHSSFLQTAFLHDWCGKCGVCTSHFTPPERTICRTVLTQSAATIVATVRLLLSWKEPLIPGGHTPPELYTWGEGVRHTIDLGTILDYHESYSLPGWLNLVRPTSQFSVSLYLIMPLPHSFSRGWFQ